MAYTDINSEDRSVQKTFADHLEKTLGWECVVAWNREIFGREGLTVDLSLIDMEKLRDEFSRKVKRKATVIEDIRRIVEEKLAQMLANNPLRMNVEMTGQNDA